MKILLVDDDVFLRDMYGTKFSDAGHVVVVADGGSSALRELSQADDFDVVLTDLIMPGMSGTDLINAIKQELPEIDTKVTIIVLSNQSEDEAVLAARELGVTDYIIKSQFIPSEVVARVEEIMSR